MSEVLALDLATTLGWACGAFPARPITQLEAVQARPRQPSSGAHRIAPPGTAVGPFLNAYEAWLESVIDDRNPAGIIFESPILPAKTTLEVVRKLIGLAGVTLMVADRRNIRWVRSAQPSEVKKHISGIGSGGKENVMYAILARGWSFATDDEADALALWDLGAHLYALERRRRAA